MAGRDKLWGQMDIWSDQGRLLLCDKQSHTVGAAVPEPPHEGCVAAAWQTCSAQPPQSCRVATRPAQLELFDMGCLCLATA